MADLSINSAEIIRNVIDNLYDKVDIVLDLIILSVIFLLSAVVGYVIGYIVSIFVKRILMTEKLQEKLVKYGAITSDLWKSTVNFLGGYVTLLITIFLPTGVFNLLEKPMLNPIFDVVWNIFMFLLFAIAGYLLGGIVYKVVKDALISMKLDEELKKYKVSDSFAGVPVSTILATIVKWYVFIIVVTFITSEITGVQYTADDFEIQPYVVGGNNFVLYQIMGLLYNYIPNAILGFVVLALAFMFSNFIGNRIKSYRLVFSDTIALGVEISIIFFGIVLSLPHFGITNIEILEYSFLILMGGISLGLAIAVGLGLKESVAHMSKKYEEKV